jgi:hypothetical protein
MWEIFMPHPVLVVGRGVEIFQKYRDYLKLIGSRWVT